MSSISSFFGLNIALKGLQAHQRSLDVTAHNVSNQNTPGYTRQEASLVSAAGVTLPAGAVAGGKGALLGGGVDVQSYIRARDAFTDLQWRVQSTVAGYTGTTENTLTAAQVTLQEPGTSGIAQRLTDFWNSWQDLVSAPESDGARNALALSAQTLVDAVKALDGHIADVQTDAQDQYDALIGANGDVQTLADQISRLNQQISRETIAGRQPNDLLDARDKAIDQLSELGQVTVTPKANGGVDISFGGATPALVTSTPPANSVVDTSGLAAMTAPGGKLGALLELADTATGKLAGYRTSLNTFVSQLVTNVNTAYAGSTTGTFFNGTTVGTFALDAAIVADPTTIKASDTANVGDNDVARAVAALAGGAADKTYATLVLTIGADVRQAVRTDAAAQAVLVTISDKRDSVSGVSLDEEVTNMIRFQRGYQASSRTMSTLDEMLDTLINRTGRVGL